MLFDKWFRLSPFGEINSSVVRSCYRSADLSQASRLRGKPCLSGKVRFFGLLYLFLIFIN